MASTLSDIEFRLFKTYIREKCGIDIQDDKAYLIETRLSKLLVDSGMESFEALYNLIMSNRDPYIAEKVIDAITTNETLWFRDKTPWKIMEDVILPRHIEELRSGKKRKIRIWSAAASTGQEAYSTAICIRDYLDEHGITDIRPDQFEILATDISKTVLEIARRGRYDAISIARGLDPKYKEKYFRKEGMVWVLDDAVKNAVRFEHFNLQNSFLFLGKFDIIFCRYVLIYFADTLKEELAKKFFDSIEPDGVMFIGASELHRCLDPYFEMVHYANGTYYVRRR